ncbi:hypothetical protein GUJ93_ZPchr0002g23801 [Zizania palustris]|uniref:Uncharacterized protein n=1 Tax=Zizania palustris TaxID=103762 RepID=A0A8J5S5Y2_ZIZPA|nr:hypothetical protein GUJ93_ZPchr0002g23801 [Zizania palustris]
MAIFGDFAGVSLILEFRRKRVLSRSDGLVHCSSFLVCDNSVWNLHPLDLLKFPLFNYHAHMTRVLINVKAVLLLMNDRIFEAQGGNE